MAIAVGLLIIAATLTTFSVSRKAFASLSNRAEIVQNSRIAFERIGRDLKQALLIVTTLPASQIEFQDGHDTSSINYIRYFTQNGGLYREFAYYAFPALPDAHVLFDELDGQGNLPQKFVLQSELVAEYINILTISASGNLLNIDLGATKGTTTLQIFTTIFARNIP